MSGTPSACRDTTVYSALLVVNACTAGVRPTGRMNFSRPRPRRKLDQRAENLQRCAEVGGSGCVPDTAHGGTNVSGEVRRVIGSKWRSQ